MDWLQAGNRPKNFLQIIPQHDCCYYSEPRAREKFCIKLPTAEPCPETACYICHAELLKCNEVMLRAIEAQCLLKAVLEKCPEGHTNLTDLIGDKANSLRASLCISPIDYTDSTSFNDPIVVKMEPFVETAVKLEMEFEEGCSQPPTADVGNSGAIVVNIPSSSHGIQQPDLKTELDEEVEKDAAATLESAERKAEDQQFNSILAIKNYQCKICDCRFRKKCKLLVHLRTHSIKKPYSERLTGDTSDSSSTAKKYECPICHSGFYYKSSLKVHLSTHNHKQEKPHECHLCQRQFAVKSNLYVHLRTHSGAMPFECSICQLQFRLKANLLAHLRVHSGVKPYQSDDTHLWTQKGDNYECNLCHREFLRLGYLKKHLKRHIGAKPHQCDVCKRCFSAPYRLKIHSRIHTGEKPYQCNICEKRFRQRNTMADHVRRHTSEKPHQCDVCQRRFVRLNDLKRHAITHTSEKPYKCEVCQRRFRQISNLKSHLKNHEKRTTS